MRESIPRNPTLGMDAGRWASAGSDTPSTPHVSAQITFHRLTIASPHAALLRTSGHLTDLCWRVAEQRAEDGLVVGPGTARPAAEPPWGPRQHGHDPLHDDLARVAVGTAYQIAAAPQMRLANQVGDRVDHAGGEPGLSQHAHRFLGDERADQLRELFFHSRGVVGAQ